MLFAQALEQGGPRRAPTQNQPDAQAMAGPASGRRPTTAVGSMGEEAACPWVGQTMEAPRSAARREHFTPQHWLLCHMGLY